MSCMDNILILAKASKLLWLNEAPQEKLITNMKGLHQRWHNSVAEDLTKIQECL